MFRYYKVQVVIIISSVIINIIVSCFTYQSSLRDNKILEKSILHIHSKAIQELIINDIKKIISSDDNPYFYPQV